MTPTSRGSSTTSVPAYQNLVGGKWVDALDGEGREILNPATEHLLAIVPEGGASDVDRAVSAAISALPGWSDATPQERSNMLLKLADAVDNHRDDLAGAESANVGKPLSMARDEVQIWSSDMLRFFAGAARCMQGVRTAEYVKDHTSFVRREPMGVTAHLAPWNYPLMEMILLIAPALAAGNTCVVKPNELTPLTALMFGRIASEILPPGVLNVITGDGKHVGAALVEHPDVRMVSLVGGTATGREVAAAAATTLKRVHLQLGGKAPVIVFDDADLDAVVSAIRLAGYCNAGQECASACRILAMSSIYEDLLRRLVPVVADIRVGAPTEGDDVEMGPLISARHRERVLGYVRRTSHARLLVGGEALSRAGYFMSPTLLADVSQEDEVVQDEVFGPVVTVQPFVDEDDAIRLANGVQYGLTSSVWTKNLDRALRLTGQLQFGTVWVNDHLVIAAEMPHGGYKQSGNGRDQSVYSLEEYTQLKHVMINVPRATAWASGRVD